MKKKEKQDCEKLKELNQKKLVDAINKASEVINNANRNQAEYIVVSPQVADVLNETFKNIERKRNKLKSN